jgi:hypothetical protein
MRRVAAPPRLLLSALSLTRPARAPRERVLEVSARYRESESLAVTLSKALDAGAEAVFATPTPALRAAVAELRRTVPVVALWPSAAALDEEGLGVGEGPTAARPGGGPGPGASLRRGITGLLRLSDAMRGDLAARLPMRLESEASGLPRRALRGVAIAAPVTDLALAAGHRRFFHELPRFVTARFGVPCGFETQNLGHLLDRLGDWSATPDFVIGPVNPCGRGMKPTPQAVREAIRRERVPVLARDLRAGGLVTLAEGARFALEAGVYGLAPDLVEMDDVADELRGLVPAEAR